MAYGLIMVEDIDFIADEVCRCLGKGSNGTAKNLLKETAGAETTHGQLKDLTEFAGMGLTQFDKLPFQDVKDRCRDTDKKEIKEYFDIDIDLVEWEHLRYNPLLALIFTRLKYKKIPNPIPTDMQGRAKYWKQFYNTEAGKGTIKHYMSVNKRYAQ